MRYALTLLLLATALVACADDPPVPNTPDGRACFRECQRDTSSCRLSCLGNFACAMSCKRQRWECLSSCGG